MPSRNRSGQAKSGPEKLGRQPTILSVFATFAVGGPQMRFAALANRFPDRWRHLVIPMDANRGAADRLAPGVEVSFPEPAIRKGATLSNVRMMRGCLRAWRPAVMVTNNWGSIEWAMANAGGLCRHIHIEDGFGPEEREAQLPRRVLTRRFVLRRNAVIVPSRTLLRIATEVWRLDPARLHYIPNGIDLARFAPGPRRSAAPSPYPGDGPVIGTVTRLRPEKNIARLLRAFRQATQEIAARLVIVGEGSERDRLEGLARELGIAGRVHFAGSVAQPASLYAGFDAFALSSDTEQMPLSVIEAMATGLPVAGTDVGDVRDMLAEENAPMIVPRDDEALAGALLDLLRDAELRARVGAANRAKAERAFDQEAMFRAYAALLDGTERAKGGTGASPACSQ